MVAVMSDALKIRSELEYWLAQLHRVPRPDAVESIRKTVKALKLKPLVDSYLDDQYGTTDLSKLDDDQLHAVLVHVRTLAALYEGRGH